MSDGRPQSNRMPWYVLAIVSVPAVTSAWRLVAGQADDRGDIFWGLVGLVALTLVVVGEVRSRARASREEIET